MKKTIATILTLVMLLSLGTTALAAAPLSLEQAKQTALGYTGVSAAEAVFTKVRHGHRRVHRQDHGLQL